MLEASEEPIPSASGEAREVTGGPVPAAPLSGTAVDREQPMAPATTVAVKPAVSSGDQNISAATTPVPPAGRFAVHVALVRNAADAAGEWQRLARRYSSLADLPAQTPRLVELAARAPSTESLGVSSPPGPRRVPSVTGSARKVVAAMRPPSDAPRSQPLLD